MQNSYWKRQFYPFWASQLLSIFGSALVQFTLVWWLTQTTGSATVLATATLFALIPQIIVQPFAGAIVDRLNRKKIIILADAMIAIATLGLGILFFTGRVEIWHVYIIMFIRAIGGAFHYPAEMASVSLMVPEDQLSRIAGLNQAANGIINLISAPLGALVLDLMGVEGSLLIDVVTATVAIGLVGFIRIPRQQRLEKSSKDWFGTILQDMKDGYRYLIGWKGLIVLTILALVFKIALSPAFSLIPLLVYQHLNGNAAQYSLVEVVAGVGIILGGLGLGVWGGFKKRVYTMFTGAIGVGIGIFALGWLPEGKFYWSLLPMFLIGFMIPIVDGPISAILQMRIDNEYQGRVMTMFGSLINLSGPIGLIAAGPVSDALGIQIWFISAGILIIASILFGMFNPHLMNIDSGPVNGKIFPVSAEE
ncbi:MAG TPA: MFS transporter [Pelolinea sp.]|nr:MFS transporter [Pelolinea sp.]